MKYILLFMFSVSKIYMIFSRVGFLDVFNVGGRVMFLPTKLGKILNMKHIFHLSQKRFSNVNLNNRLKENYQYMYFNRHNTWCNYLVFNAIRNVIDNMFSCVHASFLVFIRIFYLFLFIFNSSKKEQHW